VAFSTGRFTIRRMAAEGVVLNLLGVAIVTFASYILLR
jgi:hypothetical protein